MINWIKGIHHPEAYHGINSRTPFFEGWYHKIVTKSGHPFAIIPGIYRSAKVENNFPFVMIFDGQSGDVHFERFNINDFSAKTETWESKNVVTVSRILRVAKNFKNPFDRA